ncbi:VOC family protein [Actinopolymorpha pittospori]
MGEESSASFWFAIDSSASDVSVFAMQTNRSAPPATVTPVLVYPDVRAAVAWLEAAFGFGERVRIDDSHRAQLRVGSDGAVVVADAHHDQVAPSGGVVTQIVKVRVADVDAAFARARDFGARVVEKPTTWEYGERSCVLEDLAGHRWELTQTLRDTAPEEWGGVTVAPW